MHGVGCGHIFHYGMWAAVETVAYPVFVPVPVYQPYYYEGGWHEEPPVYFEQAVVSPPPAPEPAPEPEPEPGVEYASVATKAERQLEITTRGYDLDWWQAKRVEDLISKGIVESVLAGGEAGEKSRIVFDKTKQRLVITASPDDILKVRTIIDDDLTYKLFTQEDLGGLVVDALPLVDLRFLEGDAGAALRIAADNYAGADDLLRSSENAPFGREWWFNDRLGTMTIKDSAENLDGVYDYMEQRPYVR